MKLQQLHLLCALEQYHSFSQTAQHLFISQPALSTAMQALERELNCTLLTRNHQGVQFTAAGKMALEYAHEILNEVHLIQSIAHDAHDGLTNRITIGGNTLVCTELLLHVYLQIEKEYPQIAINFQEIDEHTLMHQLLYGALDFALLQINSTCLENDRRQLEQKYHLQLSELTNEPMAVLLSKQHPLRQKQSVSIYELFDFPFATAHMETDRRLVSALQALGYQKPPFILQDTFCLNQFIAGSTYWAFIPQREILRHQQDAKNQFLFLYPVDFPCRCAINWLHNTSSYPVEEALLRQTIEMLLRRGGK